MFGFKKEPVILTSAVILASGNSTRMGENKLLMDICGKTVIERTLEVFDNLEKISEIILVCRQEDMLVFSKICKNLKTPVKIINGGKSRTQSAFNGIENCMENTEIIAIHDCARPFVTTEIINQGIELALKNQTAIPVVAVKDTIKIVEQNIVQNTLNRENLYIVQTPQIFSANIIKNATKIAVEKNLEYTDDASCVEAQGTKINTILGSYDNIKITTIDDITLGECIVLRRGF